MARKERIYEIIKIAATCIFFIVGCLFGKLVTEHYGESLFAFIVPAIGTFIIGEFVLCVVIRSVRKVGKQKESRSTVSDCTIGTRSDPVGAENGL